MLRYFGLAIPVARLFFDRLLNGGNTAARSSCAEVRRLLQLINAGKVFDTHATESWCHALQGINAGRGAGPVDHSTLPSRAVVPAIAELHAAELVVARLRTVARAVARSHAAELVVAGLAAAAQTPSAELVSPRVLASARVPFHMMR